MIYLSGHAHESIERLPGVGLLLQPRSYTPKTAGRYATWGADNGCFTGRFNESAWITWLERCRPWIPTCLFATAPDVLGDPVATWERSAPWLPIIRQLGYPAALVAQDGLRAPDWEAFDVLFVGGSDQWKESADATALAAEARDRGKWTHIGRVNTQRRFRFAAEAGYGSADGTFLKYGRDALMPRFRSWLEWDQRRQQEVGG